VDIASFVAVADAGEPFELGPGEFALGSTVEHVRLDPCIAGRIDGKSSVGRLGLLIQNAGFIDPGFEGEITLELLNVRKRPMLLWPGMRIGQLCLFELRTPAENPYGSPGLRSRYLGQAGPTVSRLHQDWA
jgi:dCTP deaminase